MREETELIPYAVGRLDGSPLLVLAPHPDDEVFGCGGVLVQAVAAGCEVHLVILTDGAAQGDAETRHAEAVEAARRLGVPEPRFLGLPDRSLRPDDGELRARLEALLLEVEPHVVLVPSPAEIHPDHRALAMALYCLLQESSPGSELHGAVGATRLAAYEVSAVLRPNLLVDVTAEWEDVLAAARAYASQLERIPYLEVLEALAVSRRLTLPSTVRRAEAYHLVDMRYVRTHAASEWAAAQGPSTALEDATGAADIDVVVRTRNRPHLLRDALGSLRTQRHTPQRLVVVNDGGVSVADVCAASGLDVDLIQYEQARGRSAAAQTGLERCTASHVVFLDDDDLFFPEHLLVLGQAVARGVTVPYTDAVQGLWATTRDGTLEPVGRHRTFGGSFDLERLRLINHIPLPTVALPRELALEVGGFDPELDLYEDWDLLLRIAERTPFVRVPRVTCEYRVIHEAGSITAASPPGSRAQVEALAALWRRHGLLERPASMGEAVMALVAERDRAAEQARVAEETMLELRGTCDGMRAEMARLDVHRAEAEALGQRLAASERARAELAEVVDERDRQIEALRAEVARLAGILEQIYASKTWKVHELMERLRAGLRRR